MLWARIPYPAPISERFYMIDFKKYNIEIRFMAVHPAGINPLNDRPFVVKQRDWWDGDEKTWNDAPKKVEEWCEEHRNMILAVHYLSARSIRYTILRNLNCLIV